MAFENQAIIQMKIWMPLFEFQTGFQMASIFWMASENCKLKRSILKMPFQNLVQVNASYTNIHNFFIALS